MNKGVDLSRFSIDWCVATHNAIKARGGRSAAFKGVYGAESVDKDELRAEIARRSPECLELLK